MTPLVPIAGTEDPNPLLSVPQYQDITGDTASDDGDVTEAIAEAVTTVCNECTRTLLYGQYSETQYLYDTGYVYPSAVPIDVTKPIVAGLLDAGQLIYDPTQGGGPNTIVQGWGIWVGWFAPLPYMPIFSGVMAPQVPITYWGGYTSDTIPPKLRRLIATIAFRSIIANNDSLEGVPGGVKSVSVNGVSMSGNLSGFQVIDVGTRKGLRRYKRPEVEAWS